MTSKCLIALGANLPTSTRTPLDVLRHALEMMKDESIDVRVVSRWYTTPAFPAGAGPDYINAVAQVETHLAPPDVLKALARIEETLGRVRGKRWGARVCDLDLLSCDMQILPDRDTYMYWRELPVSEQTTRAPKELILPHPRIEDRAFVLIPLRDVAPDWTHPVTGRSLPELILGLQAEDIAAVKPLKDAQNQG